MIKEGVHAVDMEISISDLFTFLNIPLLAFFLQLSSYTSYIYLLFLLVTFVVRLNKQSLKMTNSLDNSLL